MNMEITKAVIDGVKLKDEEIRFFSVLNLLSKKVDKLVVDETKKQEIPDLLKSLIDVTKNTNVSFQMLGCSGIKEYIINDENDLCDYLFEQYAFYHHRKDNYATFKINEDNYIELSFS